MSLLLENLNCSYGKAPIVSNVSAHVSAGEFIGLVGPNGAGKTCLLKTIAGLLPPIGGQIALAGKPLQKLAAKDRAKQIAYLAQNRAMAWSLSAEELVALGRAPFRSSLGKLSEADESAIDTAMQTAHCWDLRHRRFDRLSGGEQMRVHLARALAVEAPLLLADEPTTALDPYFQISVLNELRAYADKGRTVLASLHDLTLAKQFCTRIWVIDDGKLIADATPDKAFSSEMLAQVFDIRSTKNGWQIL